MSGNLEYTKKFIILKNIFCTIPGKKPKGHVKIELRGLKGSLSLSVDNAEPNQNYDVVLIAGSKAYSPGKIYTEKAGRAREDIAFNLSEFEANGIRINSLSGLALTREENVLLGGYMGREDNSIERYIKNLEDILLANKPSDEPEPLILGKEPEIIISEEKLVEETDEHIIDDSEEEVEFVVSKELEEDKESLVNEEILKDIDDDIKEEVLEVKEVPGLEISEEDFVEEEEISLDDISDEEKLIKEEEIIKNLDDEIFHEETLDDEQIRLDDSPDRCGFIVEDLEDNIDLDKEAVADEKSHIRVEFIEVDEFQDQVDLEADEKFFEPAEDFKDIDSGNDEAEFIENDVQIDNDDDDVKTYIKASLDLDKLVDDETYSCEDCADMECDEIAAINLDRVITDDTYVTKRTVPTVSQEEEIDHDPLMGEIINDVELGETQEDDFNLEDYDKKIIEQYESVFENKPVESNEEVIKISHVDYENHRRMIQKNQTTDYILDILKYFPEEDPIRQHLKGYKWWRIDFQDEAKGFLPYFNYVTGGKQKQKIRNSSNGNYITARELMSTYNHYLFGMYYKNEEVQYYVYAIPGGFYKDEHPNGGSSGFNTWFEGNEIMGYWLLYIDTLTGEVIYPLNPMIPMY